MSRHRKIVIGVTVGVVSVALLLLTAILIAPSLIALEAVHDKIRSELSDKFGVDLTFEGIEVSAFPVPRFDVHQTTFTLPEGIEGSVEEVTVYPEILPLLIGSINFKELLIQRPALAITLESPHEQEQLRAKLSGIAALAQGLFSTVGALPEIVDSHIEKGSLKLLHEGGEVSALQNLKASLTKVSGRAQFEVTAVSAFAESVSLSGWTETEQRRSSAQIRISQAQFWPIHDFLAPGSLVRIQDGVADLSLDFASDGRIRLALEGADIDVREMRQAALALAKNGQISGALFEVLKAGTLPSIALKTEGRTFGDLGNLDNLVVEGQVRDAELTIPAAQLELADASGDFVLSNGTFEGQNVQARLGNSSVNNGRLNLQLFGADKPFQLQAAFRADLSEMPWLFTHVIQEHSAVQKGVAQLEPFNGKASGNLLLSRDAGKAKVKVQVSDIQLTADYPGMPFPLQIADGSVGYDENRLGFTRLTGSFGKSVFSSLSGRLQLQENPDVEISSGEGRLYLAEIVPWLGTREWMPEAFEYYGGDKGTVTVSSIHLKGPLYRLQEGHFSVSGQVEDLLLKNLPGRPGPLTIRSGNFQANPETLSYSDGRVSLLDAEIKLSATHHRYYEGLDRDVALAVAGHFGPQCIQWASKVLGVPPWLEPRPLTLSSSDMRYQKNGMETFSASLRLEDGARISTELSRSPEELIIKKLAIRDDVSRAALKLHRNNNKLDLSFSGKLYRQTLDQLLLENQFLDGWIEGDLQASIPTQSLANSRVDGDLRGRGLLVHGNPRLPLTINALVITGMGHRLFVDLADLTLAEMELKLSGRIEAGSRERPLLDMTVAADTVNLDELVEALRAEADASGEPKAKGVALLPVEGQVRLKTDRLVFDEVTWAPLRANIRLSHDAVEVTLQDAMLCGISTPGTLSLSPDNVQLDLRLLAEDQELGTALNCAFGDSVKADGRYTLRGQVHGRGSARDLLKSLSGKVELTAKDGRIYHDIVLLKVLKFLNASELFIGRANLEKMETKGFRYRSADIVASLQKGKVRYEQTVLDAHPMAIAAAGEHDLLDGSLRLNLLVAPLVHLNRVLEDIPVVGGILGTLDVVPLTVSGKYDDLAVQPLTLSAVGYQLQKLLKTVVEVPIRLIPGRRPRGTTSNVLPQEAALTTTALGSGALCGGSKSLFTPLHAPVLRHRAPCAVCARNIFGTASQGAARVSGAGGDAANCRGST